MTSTLSTALSQKTLHSLCFSQALCCKGTGEWNALYLRNSQWQGRGVNIIRGAVITPPEAGRRGAVNNLQAVVGTHTEASSSRVPSSRLKGNPQTANGSQGVKSGGVNGGISDEEVGGAIPLRAVISNVLEALDNGKADVITSDGNPVLPRRKSGASRSALHTQVPSSSSEAVKLTPEAANLTPNSEHEAPSKSYPDSPEIVHASGGGVKAESNGEHPFWQRVSDSGRDSSSGPDVSKGQAAEAGDTVVARGQQVHRVSSAERRAARRAAKGGGMETTSSETLTSASVTSRSAPVICSDGGKDTGEENKVKAASAVVRPDKGGATALPEAPPVAKRWPSSAEAGEVKNTDDDVRIRSGGGGEASSSSGPPQNDIPTVGTLTSDLPPRNKTAPERPPRKDHLPRGVRAKWQRDPRPKRTGYSEPEVHDPMVLEAAAALQSLGRDFELEGAVEKAVPGRTLGEMRIENWNEVVQILGRWGWCRQMEAIMAYLGKSGGCEANETTYERVFFGLHRNRRFDSALAVFHSMRESRFPPTTNMYNAAMSILTRMGGELPLTETLFAEMPQKGVLRDRITFSAMMDSVWHAGTRTIRGRKDKMKEATPRDRRNAALKVEALYEQMLSEGLVPDTINKNTVLNALVCSEDYGRAEEIFEAMLEDDDMRPNDRTYTIMMHMYSERKYQHKVQEVFAAMVKDGIPPTEITYNVLIRACVGTKNVREAIRLYREMASKKIPHSSCTYNSLVEVLATAGYFSQAEEVIYGMELKGVEPSPEPYNMLITGLVRAKPESFCDEAMRIFSAMQLARVKPWALTYGALMEGFGKVGRLKDMEHVYRLMRYAKLQPTTTIFTAMIHAYIRADDLETAWERFANMREVGLIPNVQTYTVLIQGLASRGELDVIDDVFAEAKEELLELDAVIYEAAIVAHLTWDSVQVADSLCQEMKDRGVAMLPHTYDKLAKLHEEKGRYKQAAELMEQKQVAYPDLEEQKRALAYGWLRDGYDPAVNKDVRPLVLDDIWAVLDGEEKKTMSTFDVLAGLP